MAGSQFPLPVPPASAHALIFRAAAANYVTVLVEGPADVEVWKPWLRWVPLAAGGRAGVLAAVNEMQVGRTGPFLGIVDADCNALERLETHPPEVVVTECHDMECDLFRAGVLDRLLATVEDKATSALLDGESLCDALVSRGVHFGYLRWLFFRRGIEYPKGRLSPARFVHSSTWDLDVVALNSEAAAVLNEGASSLLAQIEVLRQRKADPWGICNGHDLVSLLAIALRGPLRAKRKFPSEESVATGIRLAVDSSHLVKMKIWDSLGDWEKFTGCLVRNSS